MLSTLILAALLLLSPLDGHRLHFRGWEETPWQRGVRYLSISADIATAAEAACGDRGQVCARAASATLLGIAWHESGFAPDTDSPLGCYRGPDGRGPRCDGGRAVSLWQLQGAAADRALWAGDRVQAARAALRKAWGSMKTCAEVAPEEALAAYASGTCSNQMGRTRARELHAAILRASRAMVRTE